MIVLVLVVLVESVGELVLSLAAEISTIGAGAGVARDAVALVAGVAADLSEERTEDFGCEVGFGDTG